MTRDSDSTKGEFWRDSIATSSDEPRRFIDSTQKQRQAADVARKRKSCADFSPGLLRSSVAANRGGLDSSGFLRRRQDTLVAGNVAGHRLLLFASGWAFWAGFSPARVNGSIGRTSPSRPVLFSGIATRTQLLPHVPVDWQ